MKGLGYREVFFGTFGLGPFECFFCGDEVVAAATYVHHVDEDRTNNDPENLRPAHNACHSRHHSALFWDDPKSHEVHSQRMKDMMKDPAVRRQISERNSGRRLSVEHRAKISAGNQGKRRSPETRARMREGWLRRKERESKA